MGSTAPVNEETGRRTSLPWGHTNLTGSVYLNSAPVDARDRG